MVPTIKCSIVWIVEKIFLTIFDGRRVLLSLKVEGVVNVIDGPVHKQNTLIKQSVMPSATSDNLPYRTKT